MRRDKEAVATFGNKRQRSDCPSASLEANQVRLI
jgi:hypothetical protein